MYKNRDDNEGNYCGGDLGLRTFLTLYTNNDIIEFKQNQSLLDRLNKKLDMLRSNKRRKKKRIRKRALIKIEKRKTDMINDLHNKVIKNLLDTYDYISLGNIKSHNMVKDGNNNKNNRKFNDLKLYQFKVKLARKALQRGVLLDLVNENHSTKICSKCGATNDPGSSEIYTCNNCKSVKSRDGQSGKNHLMMGVYLY